MPPAQRSLRLTDRQRRQLQQTTRQAAQPGAALRATIILLSAQGHSAGAIARTLGLAVRTVYACRQRWREAGLAGLADAPRSGRPRRVSAIYLRMLLATVDKDPRSLGFAFARWTSPRLAEYLRQRTGLAFSPDWVGELLRMHGYVWRRAQLTTANKQREGEKKASRPTPQGSTQAGGPARRRLRAVVRGRRALRPAAGGACHVAQAWQAPEGAHPWLQRAGGSVRRHALPRWPLLLYSRTAQRRYQSLPGSSPEAGTPGSAHR